MRRIIIAAVAIASLVTPALMASAPAGAATPAVDNCSGSFPILNIEGAWLQVTSSNTVNATRSGPMQFWCENPNSTGVTFEQHGGVECLQTLNGNSIVGNCNNATANWHLINSVYTVSIPYDLLQNLDTKNCLYQDGLDHQLDSMACQNVRGITGDVWRTMP